MKIFILTLFISSSKIFASCLPAVLMLKSQQQQQQQQQQREQPKVEQFSYLTLYTNHVGKRGLPPHWISPQKLQLDSALPKLERLILATQYMNYEHLLHPAEKIAFLCAQDLKINNISFLLIEEHLRELRRY
jgi:hypothetical protein